MGLNGLLVLAWAPGHAEMINGRSPIYGDSPVMEEPMPLPPKLEETTAVLVFTGDNLLGARMPRLIEKHGESWPYDQVQDVLSEADLTFGNLECPITDFNQKTLGKSWESIQEKKNFIFKAPPEISARILKNSGFDILCLANNHIMDYQATGLIDTISELDSAGIEYVGAGKNIEEAFQPRIINVKGIKIGFLARSKIVPMRSKAEEDKPGLAWHGAQYSDELSAAVIVLKAQADIVVVTFHWGFEGNRSHVGYQEDVARACIDDGADLVIGHHAHVLQDMEFYNDGFIAYGLGNFLFTGASAVIESAILTVEVSRDGIGEVKLLPCWVRNGKPEPSDEERLIKRIERINKASNVVLTQDEAWMLVSKQVNQADHQGNTESKKD